MRIRQLSIYNEFHCVGADCPASCYKGWRVPVDEEAGRRFSVKNGLFGTLLRFSVIKKDGITSFRSAGNRCPFWGPDRLCAIQKRCGTDYMPLVCVQFPRQLSNFGFFCEETLFLACPETARLFLACVEENRPFSFAEAQGEACCEVNTTNDDEAFLNNLLDAREELVRMLREGLPYGSMSILHYGHDAQNACLSKSPLPEPVKYQNNTSERFTPDCAVFNTLFFNGFYHPMLRTVSPFLHQLCKRYIREFGLPGRQNPSAANRRLAAYKAHLYKLLPDLDRLLNRYYEYYLQTSFLNIFEDYSFSRHLLFGMAKTEMLWLFFALYAKNKKRLSTQELARIIAVYERRAPQIEDALKLINQS
ncbi:MAG: flagellin lysine-N-methylase [Roseburia sp.]|nr:flagellin lysine-N-methylase [Roseburia sp.]